MVIISAPTAQNSIYILTIPDTGIRIAFSMSDHSQPTGDRIQDNFEAQGPEDHPTVLPGIKP